FPYTTLFRSLHTDRLRSSSAWLRCSRAAVRDRAERPDTPGAGTPPPPRPPGPPPPPGEARSRRRARPAWPARRRADHPPAAGTRVPPGPGARPRNPRARSSQRRPKVEAAATVVSFGDEGHLAAIVDGGGPESPEAPAGGREVPGAHHRPDARAGGHEDRAGDGVRGAQLEHDRFVLVHRAVDE